MEAVTPPRVFRSFQNPSRAALEREIRAMLATGTPEQIAAFEASHTGRYLRDVLAVGRSNAYGAARERVN